MELLILHRKDANNKEWFNIEEVDPICNNLLMTYQATSSNHNGTRIWKSLEGSGAAFIRGFEFETFEAAELAAEDIFESNKRVENSKKIQLISTSRYEPK